MKKVLSIVAALALLCLGGIAQAITIDTATVANAGNAADTSSHSGNPAGQGSVGYNYCIGKYEVTAGQYAAFLNAKAATDTYALYNASMAGTSAGSGITQIGVSGSYTYSVDNAFVNRPVNYVSYWDSCRFANWLSNGQGTGSTETGAYTLTTGGIANNTITRNAGAAWAVASEDEWYKAAYYDANKAGGAGYWFYPTSSDTIPGQDMTDVSGNNANTYTPPYIWPIDSGKYTTVVGEFQNSDSPYGTFDQGGNVWEWNEATIGGANRGSRGGMFGDYWGPGTLQSWARGYNAPAYEDQSLGFRVVQLAGVPEPSSIIALLGGLVGLLGVRRLRRDRS